MVSSARGDETALALLLARVRDQVDAASHLERTEQLHVLMLHPNVRSQHFAQHGVTPQRCAVYLRTYPTTCLKHILDGRFRQARQGLNHSFSNSRAFALSSLSSLNLRAIQ